MELSEEELKQGWKYRAMARTELNKTPHGALLLAVLGIRPPKGDRWGTSGCIITPDGFVVGKFHREGREPDMGIVARSVVGFTNIFRKIADDCKFTDEERIEMFALVKKWIQKDMRAVSDINSWK